MIPIEDILPHRPPFLFLDEIVEVSNEAVLAKRTVVAGAPELAGHFPGRPIVPEVLLVEAVLEAACYLMGTRAIAMREVEAGVPVVARIDEASFERQVLPGDVLEIRARYQRTVMGAHHLTGEAGVGGRCAASLSFWVTLSGR